MFYRNDIFISYLETIMFDDDMIPNYFYVLKIVSRTSIYRY